MERSWIFSTHSLSKIGHYSHFLWNTAINTIWNTGHFRDDFYICVYLVFTSRLEKAFPILERQIEGLQQKAGREGREGREGKVLRSGEEREGKVVQHRKSPWTDLGEEGDEMAELETKLR